MNLHPETGQIAIMVADWNYPKMRNVMIHYAIHGAFEYLNFIQEVPLTELNVYTVEDMVNFIVQYADEIDFNDEEVAIVHELIGGIYSDRLVHWNDKIIAANQAMPQNWAMLGYLI